MFFETIRSEGLAHQSYLVGSDGVAAVIDPRRDCGVYLERATAHEATITGIFETHRNEDYLVGSPELARRTGAPVRHGARLDFAYGSPVRDGDRFELGHSPSPRSRPPGILPNPCRTSCTRTTTRIWSLPATRSSPGLSAGSTV